MGEGLVIDLSQEALKVVMLLAAPLLGVSLVVGLAVSIFQATTQIQEQTLTFVPKLFAIFVSIIFFGSWMLRTLIEYTENLYTNMDRFIK